MRAAEPAHAYTADFSRNSKSNMQRKENMSIKNHGGKRDNRKKRPDDKRGGVRTPGPGKKLGRPKKDKSLSTTDRGFYFRSLHQRYSPTPTSATHDSPHSTNGAYRLCMP